MKRSMSFPGWVYCSLVVRPQGKKMCPLSVTSPPSGHGGIGTIRPGAPGDRTLFQRVNPNPTNCGLPPHGNDASTCWNSHP